MSPTVITVDLITGKPTAIGTIENDIKDARFSLVKKDDTGNPLQGVQFTAYCDEGCTEILKDVGGTDVVLITGADGSASSADIRILDPSLARNIYVKETMLPQSDTHNMASEIYPLTLRAGSASKLNNGRPIVNTWKPARFELIKEDSTGNRLEGATFTAYEDAGCTTVLKDTSGADVTVTTGADGTAVSAPIKVTEQDGTRLIYVRETGLSESAAAKYAMSDTVYPVTLSANGTAKVNGGNAIVNEWLPGKVSIIKKDSTGNALAGVVFTAYSDEGCTEALLDTDDQPVILTTDDNGYAESADIAINAGFHTADGSREIYIRETFIPDALAEKYYMDPDVLTLTVNANTTTPYGEDIINRWKPAKVGITKEDDTGNKLSGVQFTVYDDEECTVTVKDVNGENVVLVTDAGGHAVSGNINVDEGCHGSDGSRTIYIRETFMPVELSLTHAINSTLIKVVLKASQTTNANNGFSFINYWKPARFKLVKVDETGNKLAGAVFTAYADAACTTVLTDSTGSEVVLTTDANGRAESADIRILQADGQRTVYIKETAQSGELAATHEMNADVIPVILEAGKTVSADDSDNIEGIVNTWKPGRFELVKKDSDGKVMPGVIFAAYEDEACETALKDVNGAEVIITTNSEGRAVSADISGMSADGTRTVYMKEVSVPVAETRDYEADDTVYRITLSAGETVTPDSGEEITNVIAHKYGKASLVKESRAGDRLEGIVFTVYEDNGCTVAAKDASGNDAVLITNGDGYAETEYIPFPGSEQSHTFYLKETALGNAQQGIYRVNDTVFPVTLREGEVTRANNNEPVINEWKFAGFVLTKIDDWYNEAVPNAQFTVYTDSECVTSASDARGEPVILKTDANGSACAKDLPVGNSGTAVYYVKETASGNDDLFVLNPNVYSVEVRAGETAVLDAHGQLLDGEPTAAVVNERVRRYIYIKKADENTGDPLSGCRFELSETRKGVIGEYTTGEDGKTEVIGLPAGEYSFRETRAPAGYFMDNTVSSFVIHEDGTVSGPVELTETEGVYSVKSGLADGNTREGPAGLYMTDKPFIVVITKIDELTSQPVPGAALKVFDADVHEVFSGVSGEDGTMTVLGLPAGTYTFKEP